MSKQVGNELLLVSPSEWKTSQVIVFDWHDGPREGICELANPKASFFFELLAERPTEDDLDDRLFALSVIPFGATKKILALLRVLGTPTNTVWVPMWKFSSIEVQLEVEREIDNLLATKEATDVVVYTRNMIEFLGRWTIKGAGAQASDLFSLIGI